MKIEKKKLADLTLCYCVAPLRVNGRSCLAVASEKEFPCLLFDERGNNIEQIWSGPGGTMTALQIAGTDGEFLATHRFYSPNNCKEASIVLCRREENGWSVKTLLELPGVHRFDVLRRNGVNWLIACTIKSDYEYKDDWRFPGKVWVCRLPDDLHSLPEDYRLPAVAIREGLLKNHGYSRNLKDGVETAIVTCEQGVFRFMPPEVSDGEWEVEELLCEPTSDALLVDFDRDGEEELLTLSPFHGDTLRVFKRSGGTFVKVYEYENPIPFAHAICAAGPDDARFAVLGHRKGERDLLALRWEDGKYHMELLDHDVGPANALSFQLDGKTVVLAANREINEIDYYTLSNT